MYKIVAKNCGFSRADPGYWEWELALNGVQTVELPPIERVMTEFDRMYAGDPIRVCQRRGSAVSIVVPVHLEGRHIRAFADKLEAFLA